MKKLMTLSMAAVFAASLANAENGVVMVDQTSAKSDTAESTVEVALVSANVWRGQVFNEDVVFQPQFTIAQNGISLNIWANYDFSKNYNGVESDLSEVDITLAYSLPVDLNDFAFDVGLISYQFPANGAPVGGKGINNESTAELFTAAHLLTLKDYVIPSVTFFGDFKAADSVYMLFDVVAPYQVSDYFWLEAGASTGWGNNKYNEYYFGADKGFTDYNFYGTASYEISEALTVSLNMTYTGLYGGKIKNAGKATYEAGEKFWGGVNLSYDF